MKQNFMLNCKKTMAKKKVQAVSFDDLKKLVVNEAKNNNNVLTQEQIDEYLMNYDLSDELAEELSKKYDKDMKFCNIDTKSAPRIAIKQKVLSLPVIRIYEDGKILDETANGDVTIENIENMIKKFV